MSSDDPITPRRSRRPASTRLSGTSPRPWASLPPLLARGVDGIGSAKVGGLVVLLLPPELAAELREAAAAVVNDPTADKRYGAPATIHLTGLAEALSDALRTTRVRRTVRVIDPEG